MARILPMTFYHPDGGARCIRKISVEETVGWENVQAILRMLFDLEEGTVWLHADGKSVYGEEGWAALVQTADFRNTKIFVFLTARSLFDPESRDPESSSEEEPEEEVAATPPLEEAGEADPSSSDGELEDLVFQLSHLGEDEDEDDVDEELESFALQLARVELNIAQLNVGQCELFEMVEKEVRERNQRIEAQLERMQKELDRANAALDRLGPRIERVLYHLETDETEDRSDARARPRVDAPARPRVEARPRVDEYGGFKRENLAECATQLYKKMVRIHRYNMDWVEAECAAWASKNLGRYGTYALKLAKYVVRYGMKNGYFTRINGSQGYLYGKAEKY